MQEEEIITVTKDGQVYVGLKGNEYMKFAGLINNGGTFYAESPEYEKVTFKLGDAILKEFVNGNYSTEALRWLIDNDLSEIIIHALKCSYAEDESMIIGRIGGAWEVSHPKDEGRLANMAEPKFSVGSDGFCPV